MKDYESFYNKFNLFAERVEASVMQIHKVLFLSEYATVQYLSLFFSARCLLNCFSLSIFHGDVEVAEFVLFGMSMDCKQRVSLLE